MRAHAPVFSEIEKLLEGGTRSSSSSSASPRSVSPSQLALDTLPCDDDDDDHDTSEMIINNLYCVSCGVELTAAGKKFATCSDCGSVAKDTASTAVVAAAAATAAPADVIPFRFVRQDTLSAEDMLRLQRKANSRKETMLGLSTSLQSWSEDMTRSFV